MNDKIDLSLIKDSKKREKARKLNDLFESLKTADKRKKSLWIEIYENAIEDRENAQILWEDIQSNILDNTINHATYGSQATKYLERMNKSNDQLLRLAEIIEESLKDSENSDMEEIYNKISAKSFSKKEKQKC